MKYSNFKNIINENALSMYFRFHYICPPETIFKNTYKLENGHYLIWKNGKIQNKVYWDVIKAYNECSKKLVEDYDTAKNELKTILINNLKKIIENNENIGIYLSSGIDSSLITSLCSNYTNEKIKTFSIGFQSKERDESSKAKKIAEFLGTNHHEVWIEESKLIELVKKIPKYYDEPFADSSEIPMIVLNEFAKENNINIALMGAGADELFCGHKRYEDTKQFQKKYVKLNPFNLNLNTIFIPRTSLKRIYCNGDKRTQTQWNIFYPEKKFKGLFKDNGNKRFYIEDKIDNEDWMQKRMVLDFSTYAVNRYTIKAYEPGTKNGIDIVGPFYSKELVEYSFRIPFKFKYYEGIKKYILKDILYEYVPKELYGEQKHGFGSPIITWIKEYFYEDIKRLSTKEFIEKQGIFNYKKITKIIKEVVGKKKPIKTYGQILWDYYMFQLWYEEYIR